jgi:BON domain
MERIQCVLLILSMMSLGATAQAPKSPAEKEAAPHTQQIAPTPGLTSQDRADQSLASAAQQEMTESTAVSTSVSASFSPLPADASPASIPNANSELQSQVQEALSKNPNFSKCSVVVTASAEGIDLSGSAGSSRERLAVWRLAASYARGKKVENHIVVNGKGGTAPTPSHPENMGPPSSAARTNGSSPGLQNNEFR